MTVWVTVWQYDAASEISLGVYSTRELALTALKEAVDTESYTIGFIEGYVVDNPDQELDEGVMK